MYAGQHATLHPERAAFIMASTGETVSYGELVRRTNRLAHLLRAQGLQRLDHYAIFMENNVNYLPMCWAAQRSGLYFTCVSSRLTAGELEYIVKDCNAKIFITSNLMGDVAAELDVLLDSGLQVYDARLAID